MFIDCTGVLQLNSYLRMYKQQQDGYYITYNIRYPTTYVRSRLLINIHTYTSAICMKVVPFGYFQNQLIFGIFYKLIPQYTSRFKDDIEHVFRIITFSNIRSYDL